MTSSFLRTTSARPSVKVEDRLVKNLKSLDPSSNMDDHKREQVAKILSSTQSPRVRNAAALAIADLKYEPGIPALIGQLSRPETLGFRGTILYALERLEAKVPALILARVIIDGGYEAQAGALELLNTNLDLYDSSEVAEALSYVNKNSDLTKTEPVKELYEVLTQAAAQFPDGGIVLRELSKEARKWEHTQSAILPQTSESTDTNDLETRLRRRLEEVENAFGSAHPNVATCLNNLASLLRATNRLDEAEPLYRRALAIDETSYGPDHPEVGTDLNNLALLLANTNRLDEAEPLYRRALAIDEASYGPDHPNTIRVRENLEILLDQKSAPPSR